MEINDRVFVYDRFRFAIPLRAIVIQFSHTNDGVRVMLEESNSRKYPIGSRDIWVHSAQLRRRKKEMLPWPWWDRDRLKED